MLLIVAHHYVVNSGLTAADGPIFADPMSLRSLFLLEFGAFGKTGINCFVLITGYFMCKSQITAKKFFKLLLEIEFFSITIFLIFCISGYEAFSFKELLKAILPITSVSSGFTECYLLFLMFIPFLNLLIRNINEKQHILLLLLCAFIYIFIGSLPKFIVSMNYVTWFIVIYIIGSYLRLYEHKLFNNTRFWGWMTIVMLLISLSSVVVLTWIGSKTGVFNLAYFFLADSNKILAVTLSVSAFLFFKNVRIKQNRFINKVAASTFGVLLIHAASGTMRRWLWVDLLRNAEMYGSVFMPIHAVGSVIVIIVVCTIIDFLRIRFIEKPVLSLWDRLFPKVKNWFAEKEEALCIKLNIRK